MGIYEDLITSDRIRASTRGTKPIEEEVESDRARVMYSASFRRLQRKTQVFPLEDNASVRTRLTHSLEVAHVGRYLASSVVSEVEKHGLAGAFGLVKPQLQHAFTVTVEVACLLHDIGNPPFGHFGEFAIAKWFERKEGAIFDDLRGFDGNPQGFRIISRLNGADGQTGMNLTLAQLAATLKYQSLPSERNEYSKFGVFYSEQDVLGKIRQRFGLRPEQRFPLAYLMEAADDISYCLSDIEDGIEKRIVTHRQVVEALKEETSADPVVRALIDAASEAADRAAAVDKVVSFRSTLITHLVQQAAREYVAQHANVIEGTLHELISANSAEGRLLKAIKGVVRRTVYSDPSIQSLELAGMAVITGLLEKLENVLALSREQFSKLLSGERIRGLDVERRLVDFFGEKHSACYRAMAAGCDDAEESWHRAHLVVDYISGMTDPFALEMHRTLGGNRL